VHAEEVGPVFRQAWAEMQSRTSLGQDRYNSVPGGERAWWGEFVKEVLGQLDHDAPWEPLLDDLYAAFSDDGVWRVFPETVATLRKLRNRGLALAVISNWDRRLPDIIRSLNLFDWFEVITVSAIEGVEKPSPEIFKRTSSRLGVDSCSTLHVGDAPLEDYAGARNAGFAAVLIDRHDLFVDEDYRRISSLDEVLSIIDG
jgi:putative hydrolase of the HAD superfamily